MERIKELSSYQKKYERKLEIEKLLEEAEADFEQTKKELKKLEKIMKKELSDVEALGKRSLSNALLAIIGKLDDKERKERKEAEMAKLQFDTKQDELEILQKEISSLKDEYAIIQGSYEEFNKAYYELKKEIDSEKNDAKYEYLINYKNMMDSLHMQKLYTERKEFMQPLLPQIKEIYKLVSEANFIAGNTYSTMDSTQKYNLLNQAQFKLNTLHKMIYECNYKYKNMRKINVRKSIVPSNSLKALDSYTRSRMFDVEASNFFGEVKNDISKTYDDILALFKEIDVDISRETQKYNYSKKRIEAIEQELDK